MAAKKRASKKMSTQTTAQRAKSSAKKKSAPKRMGRPPRAGGAAEESIRLRVTRAEYATLAAAADQAGKPLAAYVRDAALSVAEKH